MGGIPRLNGVIRALEDGQAAFCTFVQADVDAALAVATSRYDGIVFEMEHNPWDVRALRDSMQYLLNRGQIVQAASLAPSVTPMVRIPPNGDEKKPMVRQAGTRLGCVRDRLAAHQYRRSGLQCGRGMPLSAPKERAIVRTGRHPW